ncbi:MAG TPA: hypothetical protein VII43_00845 [Opitutaceae bacterium]
MNPSTRRMLLGFVALAIAVGGVLAWRLGRASVGKEEVAAFLDKSVGGGIVRFEEIAIEPVRRADGDQQLRVSAKASAVQPLYSKADAADYLARAFQLDPDSGAEARRLLADKSARSRPENAAAGPFPADPFEATVLQPSSPAGPFRYKGVLSAHREGGAWTFSLLSGSFEGGGPQGQPRSGFASDAYVVGDTADDARLRALAADFQGFAIRLEKVRTSAERARSAARESRKGAFLALIAPGRVFRGQAQETGEQNPTAIYLEIVSQSENEVTALLRNDGGWRSARAFQGTWGADDDFQNPVLNLSSAVGQAVRNAGPFLENTQTWTFALHEESRSGLSERSKFYQYRFQLMGPEQVSELKARLEGEFNSAMAASEPGLLYQGTAVSRATGASEPVLLRFTGRSEDGGSLEATMESTTRSWKRPLHGSIFGNARRSGAEPVRLRSGQDEAAVDAPATSVLGDRDDLDLRLGTEGRSLVGEDAQFTYRFAATGQADLRRLESDRALRARRFNMVVRGGIAYDGFLHEEQGFVTQARLEITRVDPQTGSIAARIHSLARPNVYREFFGTCDPSGSSMVLGATARGNFGTDDSFDVPFLKGGAPANLHLALTGTSITGGIEGNADWRIEFPAATFLSAPTESTEANSPPANGSVFPAFPKEGGAYLLAKGQWSPMPRNQGHVAIEMVRTKGEDLRMPTNLVGAVDEAIGTLSNLKEKQKFTYLEFDGKDPRPESSGPAIVILFVGAEPPGTPPLELAPEETTKEGPRRLEIGNGPTSEIRFGERREAAYVRRAAPGYLLYTSTAPLAPGPYAFNADVGYELTQQ